MTSTSGWEHMWIIVGWIHNKHINRLTQTSVEKTVRVHDNLVLRKDMMKKQKNKVGWDSQTAVLEPVWHTDEEGVDDVDDEDSVDDTQM